MYDIIVKDLKRKYFRYAFPVSLLFHSGKDMAKVGNLRLCMSIGYSAVIDQRDFPLTWEMRYSVNSRGW